MRTVRRLFSQQHQTFDEIDLTQFDFDEVNRYFTLIYRRLNVFRLLLMHDFNDHVHRLVVFEMSVNLKIQFYQNLVRLMNYLVQSLLVHYQLLHHVQNQ